MIKLSKTQPNRTDILLSTGLKMPEEKALTSKNARMRGLVPWEADAKGQEACGVMPVGAPILAGGDALLPRAVDSPDLQGPRGFLCMRLTLTMLLAGWAVACQTQDHPQLLFRAGED